MARSKKESQWPFIRDIILFAAGLLGAGWETLHGPVEPSLLVMFGAMMGLPIFLRKDE